MNNGEWNKLVSVAGRILLAFLFVFSQSAWARQEQKAQDNQKPAQKAAAQTVGEKPSSAAATAKAQTPNVGSEESEKASPQEKLSGDGKHEGIKVHGHWTIEVRNSDGSLARHVEFENSLDPGFSIPNPRAGQNPFVLPGGAAYLSAVSSGQWLGPVPPSFWTILLVGPSGLSNLTNTTNAPCTEFFLNTIGACILTQSTTCVTIPGYNCALSVTPLGTANAPYYTGLQLSGSVQATENGQISTVATLIQNITCPASVGFCQVGGTPVGGGNASFTSSSNFPGAPIAVVAGQTIAVTVNISFS